MTDSSRDSRPAGLVCRRGLQETVDLHACRGDGSQALLRGLPGLEAGEPRGVAIPDRVVAGGRPGRTVRVERLRAPGVRARPVVEEPLIRRPAGCDQVVGHATRLGEERGLLSGRGRGTCQRASQQLVALRREGLGTTQSLTDGRLDEHRDGRAEGRAGVRSMPWCRVPSSATDRPGPKSGMGRWPFDSAPHTCRPSGSGSLRRPHRRRTPQGPSRRCRRHRRDARCW